VWKSNNDSNNRNNKQHRAFSDFAAAATYRARYGKLESARELFAKHPGWRENATTFVSPDGERSTKSMSANNLRVLLQDMEAHVGKKLVKASRTTSTIWNVGVFYNLGQQRRERRDRPLSRPIILDCLRRQTWE
jgi:hypothetical protein